MSCSSPARNLSRSIKNYAKGSPKNARAITSKAPGGSLVKRVVSKDSMPAEERQQLDNLFLEFAHMRIQPNVDSEAKTIHTPVGDLPVAPLMNPSYLAAKRKYKCTEPKAMVDVSKHGKMEKRLARNPYAWALAGPARRDGITQTILPRFFLQDFAFIKHPDTKAPWMIPASLMLQESQAPEVTETVMPENSVPENDMMPSVMSQSPDASSEDSDEFQAFTASTELDHDTSAPRSVASNEVWSWVDVDDPDGHQPDDAFVPASPEDKSRGYTRTTNKHSRPRAVPRPASKSVYSLCRREALAAIAPKAKNAHAEFKGYHRVRMQMIATAYPRPVDVVYRADMDSFVLDLMRTQATDQLLHYAHICDDPASSKKYLVRCRGSWDEVVEKCANYGCVLWLGDCEDQTSKRPGEFETVRLGSDKPENTVIVHDLTVLLGSENVKKLREESNMFSKGSTFMLGRQKSTRLQLRLWKLHGYLASYRDSPKEHWDS